MQSGGMAVDTNVGEHVLNVRLEEVGWALFLIMIGALWIMPAGTVPSHTWLLGAGLIMLGINLARYFASIEMSGFTVFLGVVAVVAGMSGFFGVDLPIFPAVFIVLGFSLLMRALFKRRS